MATALALSAAAPARAEPCLAARLKAQLLARYHEAADAVERLNGGGKLPELSWLERQALLVRPGRRARMEEAVRRLLDPSANWAASVEKGLRGDLPDGPERTALILYLGQRWDFSGERSRLGRGLARLRSVRPSRLLADLGRTPLEKLMQDGLSPGLFKRLAKSFQPLRAVARQLKSGADPTELLRLLEARAREIEGALPSAGGWLERARLGQELFRTRLLRDLVAESEDRWAPAIRARVRDRGWLRRLGARLAREIVPAGLDVGETTLILLGSGVVAQALLAGDVQVEEKPFEPSPPPGAPGGAFQPVEEPPAEDGAPNPLDDLMRRNNEGLLTPEQFRSALEKLQKERPELFRAGPDELE